MENVALNKKATILLVDDIPDDLALISNLLKDVCKLKIANSGEKAMKIAISDPTPDLIILDIMMPGMDGYEVCYRLKHDHKTMNIPVIFLTAKTNEFDEKKGLELGAVDFIAKPISPDVFIARVKNHLALKLKSDQMLDQKDYLELEVAMLKHPIPSTSHEP
jgi:putative two-component system response regulator